MDKETIAAISTPYAAGGISIVRISGSEAISVADRVFKLNSGGKLSQLKGYTARLGVITDTDNNRIDEGIALVFKAPCSYTGEDVVEISCHGGIFVTKKVLKAVLSAGASTAGAGEFTKRAFLNGKLDLTAAEGVIDIINSDNEQSLRMAQVQTGGRLFKTAAEIKSVLLRQVAFLSAWADYPEEDIEEVSPDTLVNELKECYQRMDKLLKGYDTGMIIKNGIRATIAGKPNVGKSTLMNLLVGYEKSIVTDIAGTTRDVVEEDIKIGDYTIRMADTAGIRQTSDVVEQFGVDKAYSQIDMADLVFLMFDSGVAFSRQDYSIVEYIKSKEGKTVIAVINKSDLECVIDLDYIKDNFNYCVYISANNNEDVIKIHDILTKVFAVKEFDMSAGVLANERQRDCLSRAADCIKSAILTIEQSVTYDAVTVEIEQAIECMLELTGEDITKVVVDEVFSNFCVGK